MAQHPKKFINRELSWLEFNHRVLEEAQDRSVPLLERLKFLAITDSNLNEFFMVRVGGLCMLEEQGSRKTDPAGLTPSKQLSAIRRRVSQFADDQYQCYNRNLEPALKKAGVSRMRFEELSDEQKVYAAHIFENEISPVISPIAVDLDAELPLTRNLHLHLIVRLKPVSESMRPRFALIPVGINIKRFIQLPADKGYEYLCVEDLVKAHVHHLFKGEEIAECVAFKITRNADLSVREDLASDLLAEMETVLEARKVSECVRLEVEKHVSRITLNFLKQVYAVGDERVVHISGPLRLSDFMSIATMDGFEQLVYTPWLPQQSIDVDPKASIFSVLAKRNVLLYHPYESFEPVLRFIQEASEDPDVLAIKQILYRTSKNSPIIAALKQAAEHGKYVTAIVELKARFDEARNIEWAKELEQAGVQVVYGVKGLKTHGKIAIVVRRESRGIVRYCHFGTGNYNESTARLYTDISYLTTHEELGRDGASFFNAITGYSQPQQYRHIAAAPAGLRDTLLKLIEQECERKKHGQKALIMAKMNSLVDPKIIKALYAASQTGVEIHLNVRGICCLRAGVAGLSENIRVVSIIDRFLEHARIFYFLHGGDEKLFISSADWMQRNLDKRVELMAPVIDAACRRKLTGMLETHFKDTVKGRILTQHDTWVRLSPKTKKKGLRCQEALHHQASKALTKALKRRRTTFEPHRPPDSRS
ncbi:MAG: polyphosphate kinase 1 [Chitinivibrionales bacterium]|nr:polyphosphate kinase 1 [Chitinivibrionales bacterium]